MEWDMQYLKDQKDYEGSDYPAYGVGKLYDTRANREQPLKAFTVNMSDMSFGDVVSVGAEPVLCLGLIPNTISYLFLGTNTDNQPCEFVLPRSLDYGLVEIE